LPFVFSGLHRQLSLGGSVCLFEQRGRTAFFSEEHILRLIARRTWRFFETFVSGEDHFLPPENFQEEPKPVVAHRTSPTNVGMYLLSTVAARDFGWLSTSEALERIEATLATMRQLELYRGHLFNWYDTRDLHPLDPKYISSVDSGNLAGHLLVLSNSCGSLSQIQRSTRILTDCRFGLAIARSPSRSARVRRAYTVTKQASDDAVDERTITGLRPADAWVGITLAKLRERARIMDDIAQTLSREGTPVSDVRIWTAAAEAALKVAYGI
jgi:cyclic beta-1,2-glucan synthetase